MKSCWSSTRPMMHRTAIGGTAVSKTENRHTRCRAAYTIYWAHEFLVSDPNYKGYGMIRLVVLTTPPAWALASMESAQR